MNKLFRSLLLLVLISPWLSACYKGGMAITSLESSVTPSMIEPGDRIGTLIVTTGADHVPPLWAFCSRSTEGGGSYLLDCHTPVLDTLGIGNILTYADEEILNLDWSDLAWQLSIDGQQVNLASFGTFDYVMPGLGTSPSQVREVLKRGTAWDIALQNLVPGHHTLWFVAQHGTGSTTWFVSLDIESGGGTKLG